MDTKSRGPLEVGIFAAGMAWELQGRALAKLAWGTASANQHQKHVITTIKHDHYSYTTWFVYYVIFVIFIYMYA